MRLRFTSKCKESMLSQEWISVNFLVNTIYQREMEKFGSSLISTVFSKSTCKLQEMLNLICMICHIFTMQRDTWTVVQFNFSTIYVLHSRESKNCELLLVRFLAWARKTPWLIWSYNSSTGSSQLNISNPSNSIWSLALWIRITILWSQRIWAWLCFTICCNHVKFQLWVDYFQESRLGGVNQIH